MKPLFAVSLLLIASLVLAACAPQTAAPAPTPVVAEPTPAPALPETAETATRLDIVDAALADGRFTTLAAALSAAGLVDTLKGEGPFTVFAPTDEAFAALPAGTVEALLMDIPALTDILLYHVVAGAVPAAQVVELDGQEVETIQGSTVSIAVRGGSVYLNETTQVIITDIETSNGIIHVIDAVLLPESGEAGAPLMNIVETAVADGRFTTLAAALGAAGLVETLESAGPFTVFAPTDEAFAALPAGTVEALLADIPALTDILLYHVVSGEVLAADVVSLDGQEVETALAGSSIRIGLDMGSVVLNDSARVIITDIQTSNGIIHVIDAVLLPPAEESLDIVDTAVADGRFTTLAAALGAADLIDTLKSEGPFTVFAPTDEAFAALPAGTVEALLADIPALTDILLYHVVAGEVLAADVVELDGQEVETVLGETLRISVRNGNVYLNDTVQVIITDIAAANGVIHVIDAVLLPSP
jgi:transforming growth factor-beta-induced protein